MARPVLLDTGPLGMVTHPRANPQVVDWFRRLLKGGAIVLVPEIADYELRRELIRSGKSKSIARLDELQRTLTYLPITSAAMRKAADFWANARNRGQPTAADAALDGDMILAAQAATYAPSSDVPIIATTNVGHLALFSDAQLWHKIR